MSLRRTLNFLLLLSFAVIVLAPAATAADSEEAKVEKKDPAMSSQYPYPEKGRHGNLTYRERINLLTRHPMKKQDPAAPRPDLGTYTGIHDGQPVLARKVEWFANAWIPAKEHSDTLGRTTAIGPFTPEQRKNLN